MSKNDRIKTLEDEVKDLDAEVEHLFRSIEILESRIRTLESKPLSYYPYSTLGGGQVGKPWPYTITYWNSTGGNSGTA